VTARYCQQKVGTQSALGSLSVMMETVTVSETREMYSYLTLLVLRNSNFKCYIKEKLHTKPHQTLLRIRCTSTAALGAPYAPSILYILPAWLQHVIVNAFERKTNLKFLHRRP
jgi:hypothetical protein